MRFYYTATESEEEILSFANSILGRNLASFLLSGLGEGPNAQSRIFTATGASSPVGQRSLQFEILTQAAIGLSTGKDPLILAVLVNQLWGQKTLSNEITLPYSELLNKLQWPDSPESFLLLKQAIERYFSTSYGLFTYDLPESERIEGRYSHLRGLLIGYDITTEHFSDNPDQIERQIMVRFSPDFIKG